MEKPGITIVGLGPAGANLLTREAWEWLTSVSEVYLRTAFHPCVKELPTGLEVHSFDDVYEQE
ncbi:MAG TPA: nucleoside triphosphate pyrophosphohydrolase, partial [Anaerolineaceae bacterium]|nr:nucleoside triphosphate pyrophosphohydrolase [Anaerolineaceae bacterium]